MSGGNFREQAATEAERAANELEVAAAHLRTAARHITGGEVPRYAAHLLATQGHLLVAERIIEELAVRHARASRPLAEEAE